VKKFVVMIDRGFRDVPPLGVGEFDEKDPEVLQAQKSGFLVELEEGKKPKTAPAEAQGHSEDEKGE
jgi:hypothetical protein